MDWIIGGIDLIELYALPCTVHYNSKLTMYRIVYALSSSSFCLFSSSASVTSLGASLLVPVLLFTSGSEGLEEDESGLSAASDAVEGLSTEDAAGAFGFFLTTTPFINDFMSFFLTSLEGIFFGGAGLATADTMGGESSA